MIKIHLSRLLGEKRWTQKDLAEATGIRPSTINEWYHEFVTRINLDHVDKICEVLECDISDLIEYVPNQHKITGKDLIVEEHGKKRTLGYEQLYLKKWGKRNFKYEWEFLKCRNFVIGVLEYKKKEEQLYKKWGKGYQVFKPMR